MAETHDRLPVHETLSERLDAAETRDERRAIIRAFTREEIEHKRDIYDKLARG